MSWPEHLTLYGQTGTAAFAAAAGALPPLPAVTHVDCSKKPPADGDVLCVRATKVVPLAGRRVWVLHDSLLPHSRGFSPVPWAVEHGHSVVGLSGFVAADSPAGCPGFMEDRGTDGGPLWYQRAVGVSELDSSRGVYDRLAPLYAEAVKLLVAHRFDPPQHPHTGIPSYCGPRVPSDDFICWSAPAVTIYRRVLAAHRCEKTSARFVYLGISRRLLPSDCEVLQLPFMAHPGSILFYDEGAAIVATGSGALRISTLDGAPAQQTLDRIRERLS